MSLDHAFAFLFAALFEPLAYAAGIVWCFGMALIVFRTIDRALNKSQRKEV